MPDLKVLSSITNPSFFSTRQTLSLSSCGLVEIVAVPTVRAPEAENKYEITEFGKFFIKIVLNESEK
ncbi:MAG: hypothetical protein ABH873_06390 [Candidatus Firestonebacteria bacterium]